MYAKPSMLLVCNTPYGLQRDITHTAKRSRTIEGQLSPNARRKLRNAIRWLVAASDWKMIYEKRHGKKVPWKINEFTLTFHDNMQDDRKARGLLSMWLEVAKYRWDMHLYIWKAEPQERGAIHFHGITNTYIPHTELKYTWNRLLHKHGLNSINDNSTDVHAVTGIKNHEVYLTDYMLNEEKHKGRRAIKGKLWGCSHALSQAGKEYLVIDEDECNMTQKENNDISLYERYILEGKEIPEFLKFTDIYLTGEQYYKHLPECNLKKLYYDQIQKLKNLKSQKEFWPR